MKESYKPSHTTIPKVGDVSPTPRANHHNTADVHFIASTPPNLTNTHPQSTDTSGKPMVSYTKEMSVNKKPKKSPTLTYSPLDSRASLLVLLESWEDFRTPEGLSFLKWLGFSTTKDPDIFYSKTSRTWLVTTMEKLSRRYLGFLPTLGTDLNGKYLIQRAGSPRIERGYSLSDILEENVDARYFLSEKMMAGLMKGFSKPQMLDASTGTDIQEDTTPK